MEDPLEHSFSSWSQRQLSLRLSSPADPATQAESVGHSQAHRFANFLGREVGQPVLARYVAIGLWRLQARASSGRTDASGVALGCTDPNTARGGQVSVTDDGDDEAED